MELIQVLTLAVVQGITEFLPISSSGHLIILHELLSFDVVNNLAFDVALHLGTACSIIVYFRKEIRIYTISFFAMFRSFNLQDEKQKTVINIIIATIPGVLLGLFIEPLLENYLRKIDIVAAALIIVGILFLIVERKSKQKLWYEGLSMPEAFLIGVAQAFALIPGVSRSGITMITGMSLNLKRSEAAKFSFLLSLPIVLGAGLKIFFDLNLKNFTAQDWYLFALGIVVSAVTGFLVIKYLLRFLEKSSLSAFAVYRIVLGIVLIVWLLRMTF